MATAAVDLAGRTALVTGASRGIGRSIALTLAAAGASVAVNYRERAAAAAAVIAEIEAIGQRALAVRADVTRSEEVTRLIATVERELAPIDILINNAGIAGAATFERLGEQEFDQAIAGNLKSAFLCMQAVLGGMRTRHWGRIVNISSGAARGPGLIGPLYNAAKAGLEGLTRGYAVRVGREGITVNAVAPGPIDTDMSASIGQADAATRIPLGRFGHVEEVAQAVLMVIGNPYITGQTIAVNGGMLMI